LLFILGQILEIWKLKVIVTSTTLHHNELTMLIIRARLGYKDPDTFLLCYSLNMQLNNQSFLGVSKNDVKVKYDQVNPHSATHFEGSPKLKDLVIQAISRINLNGQEIKTYIDMGRVVGTIDVVKVDDSDDIVYGIRKNCAEDGLVPFTKSRAGKPCPYVAMHLVPQSNKSYTLSSAWIGIFGDDDEPFPQSPNMNDRSVDFWNKHAFIYGSQEIISGTETSSRPW